MNNMTMEKVKMGGELSIGIFAMIDDHDGELKEYFDKLLGKDNNELVIDCVPFTVMCLDDGYIRTHNIAGYVGDIVIFKNLLTSDCGETITTDFVRSWDTFLCNYLRKDLGDRFSFDYDIRLCAYYS